ncbi:hypothetical protein [Candidatus Frankia alpina]|uniref:hypothetical protein n=1 Tax=Candidatus Frankia alpina TaxID=2699483 RepID=UPI0013D46ED4|nr:hypothetical protein [Candidatus Frankia alpina]
MRHTLNPTAAHEAGHVVAARLFDARGVTARLHVGRHGTRGMTRLRAWRAADTDFVVYILAGPAAGRLITGNPALVGSDDLDVARRITVRIGASYRDAEQRAARLVRQHRADIERTAALLLDHGRI